MQRAFVAAVIGLTLGGLDAPAAAAPRKPKLGIFGTINGMRFKAPDTKRNQELVGASYIVEPETGFALLSFGGFERPRRRGATQVLEVICLVQTSVLPWSSPCSALYRELRIKRRSLLESDWAADAAADGNGVLTGPFTVTLESFDGVALRGSFSGSLASLETCTNGQCVGDASLGTVSGEGTFTISSP